MTSILMVDTDVHLVSGVARALARYGVTVSAVGTPAHALSRTQEAQVALVIIDASLVSPDELDAFGGTPLLVTASFLSPELAQGFARSARILKKPFTSAELSLILSEEIEFGAFGGSLVDVLNHGHVGRQSFRLRVGEGELVLEDGELVHASLAEVSGEAALVEILAGGGAVVRTPTQSTARTIHRPFRPLLLEALSLVEELERVRATNRRVAWLQDRRGRR